MEQHSFPDVYKRQVISPGNFNGVGQVIYDTVAFPNILGELYVIDYELI